MATPLAPDDLALVFVALTREFVGRVEPKTTAPLMPSDPPTSGRAVSGDLLGGCRGLDEQRGVSRRCEEDLFEGVNTD
jgi:hypothetical protein